ncbi:MAG: ORC1-type DNA replication protein [Thermoproteota archaeon]|nr:ORC1-type DNA replication protein [Thermoproteota archaeon]
MLQYSTVFKDETKLDINYVPAQLPHRNAQLQLLNQFFRCATEQPGKMSQRVLIAGKIGTGKTVLSQIFGFNITKKAEKQNINLHYVHVNCRERKGSLFLILQQIIHHFHPNFPKRGYSTEELMPVLMQTLDEQNAYLILALDELESLIQGEGSDAVYKLTRIQESRAGLPRRLSLICILRNPEQLEKLDSSTRSTLQHNFIYLKKYSKNELCDILNHRVKLAFKPGTVPEETVYLAAKLAASEEGNARYAIELLWRAGKYSDASKASQVLPESVRKAVVSVYPTVRKDYIFELSFHQKLFLLSVARRFQQTSCAYVSMGELEKAYNIVCEEFGETPRGHSQLWNYVKNLSGLGVLDTELSGKGKRGRTTLVGLPFIPASDLERELSENLRMMEEGERNFEN